MLQKPCTFRHEKKKRKRNSQRCFFKRIKQLAKNIATNIGLIHQWDQLPFHAPVSITSPPSRIISMLNSPVFRRELADRNREFYELNTLLWLRAAMRSNYNLLSSSRNSNSVYGHAKELWENADWKAWLEATKFIFLLQAGLISKLHQGAQDIIQPCSKSLKGWSPHNLSRCSLWVLPLCSWRSFYLTPQVEFFLLQLVPLAFCSFFCSSISKRVCLPPLPSTSSGGRLLLDASSPFSFSSLGWPSPAPLVSSCLWGYKCPKNQGGLWY